MWGRLATIGMVCAGLAAAWLAMAGTRAAPSRELDAVRPLEGELLADVVASGVVAATDSVDVKYPFVARVERLLVREGDRVHAGQLLAQMDTAAFRAQLAQVQATLARTEVQLAEARRLMDLAIAAAAPRIESDPAARAVTPAQSAAARTRVHVQRARRQWERLAALAAQGFIADSDAEGAEADYRMLLHQLESDEEAARLDAQGKTAAYHALLWQREADAAAVRQVEVQLAEAEVRAPRAGVVTTLYVRENEFLGSPNAARPTGKPNNVLLTLSDPESLSIEADVNAVDIGRVRVGQSVRASVDSLPGRDLAGVVTFIALEPTVTNNVTTYRVTMTLTVRPTGLRMGLPSQVRIAVGREAGLLVPLTAVRRSSEGAAVLGVRRGAVEVTPVELGLHTATAAVVRRGLGREDVIARDATVDARGPVEPRLQAWSMEPGRAPQPLLVPKGREQGTLERLFRR